MDLGPAGQFTAYKKKPLDHVRPKLSSKSHVFQSFTGSRCIAQSTAIRAVLSTTINRRSLIGVPHLIVAKCPLVTGLFAKAARARLVGRPMACGCPFLNRRLVRNRASQRPGARGDARGSAGSSPLAPSSIRIAPPAVPRLPGTAAATNQCRSSGRGACSRRTRRNLRGPALEPDLRGFFSCSRTAR